MEDKYEGIDGFFTKLTEAADIVTEKLIDVAPEAAEAILNIVQFKGAFNLVLSGLLILLIPIVAFQAWSKAIKFVRSKNGSYFSDIVYMPLGLATVIAFIPWIIAFSEGWSFYNWLSAFYPEGAVALRALEAVGINL